MNKQIILELFEKTTKYRQPRKESLNELRDCYEQYSGEYIYAPDFLNQLSRLGFESNKTSDVKLKMKKEIRKMYFMPGMHKVNIIPAHEPCWNSPPKGSAADAAVRPCLT